MTTKEKPDTPFKHIPQTSRGSFILNFYAAIYFLICFLHRLSDMGGEKLNEVLKTHSFLTGYFNEMNEYLPQDITWFEGAAWWEKEILAWEKTVKHHLPLWELNKIGINFSSRCALMILGLMEEDSRFGSIFAKLQSPLNFRRPCLEVVGQIMMGLKPDPNIDPWTICSPLLNNGIVEVLNKESPRSEWELKIPAISWNVIRGDKITQPFSNLQFIAKEKFPKLKDLIIPASFAESLKHIPKMVREGRTRSVVLNCTPGSDGPHILGTLAKKLGYNSMAVELNNNSDCVNLENLGALCTLTHALPIFSCDLGPGETANLPNLTGYNGPVTMTKGLVGGLKKNLLDKAIILSLPPFKVNDRLLCWQQVFTKRKVKNIDEINMRFRLPAGYIRQASSLAIDNACLSGREEIQTQDIQKACRSLNHQQLDSLAARIKTDKGWNRLIVSKETKSKLQDLESRCRFREKLTQNLGLAFGSEHTCGVRALLSGASGTGKTLAARILAAELGIDLYRVDLAAVVNKYIGETEKNLHRVLSRAEELDVILLLDEGDALLGKRTEVKSSNDRYANLETDYLLQKLETYQGIILVTTNAGENIDRAFRRRMDVVINFIPPGVEERQQIWQIHLPKNHTVDWELLDQVSFRCVLTGGQIRNAALQASVLALDNGGIVTDLHLKNAILSEYRKAGAISPLNNNNQNTQNSEDMEAFLNIITS